MKLKRAFGALVLTAASVFVLLHVVVPWINPEATINPIFLPVPLPPKAGLRHGNSLRHNCTDVIRKMLRGHWEEHLTEKEKLEMYKYYQTLKIRNVPYGIQRPDGRCGNVYHGWYRALCRPDGATPCCYNHVCVNATIHNCTCPNCFDLRAQIEADHATWWSDSPGCHPRQRSVAESCALLHNATVYFIGDSQIRHLYFAFAMTAKGTEEKVFETAQTPQDLVKACRGRLMLEIHKCRKLVHNNPHLCNDTVRTRYLQLRGVTQATQIISTITSLVNVSRSLVILGIGIDDMFNVSLVQQKLWRPLLKQWKGSAHPKLVWTTPHQNGLIKAIDENYHQEYHQDTPHITAYTEEMQQFLDGQHVPVLNLYQLTKGVVSQDGTHHGIGVNRVEAQVVLHHIEELHRRGEW